MTTTLKNLPSIFALVLAACGGTTTSTPPTSDGGSTMQPAPQVCTPNEMSCLSDSLAVTCNAAGTAIIPTQCGVGQTCTAGVCKGMAMVACTAADDTCTDSSHALLCTATGAQSITCPTGTTCIDEGICQGACTVGSSTCQGSGTVATCSDGFHFTTMGCGTGTACVLTSTTPYATSACMPSECTPDTNGCNAVCGDETQGGTGTATDTVSVCVATPSGFHWLATRCSSTQMCNSTGGSCNGGVQAACASQCNPGDTQCAGTAGYVTCGADGTWSTAMTACDTDPTTDAYTCFSNASGQGVCGDFACVDPTTGNEVTTGNGACDGAGQFHACGTDGRLGAAQACSTGLCIASGATVIGDYQPGSCLVECQAGDTHCLATGDLSDAFQTCTNGTWAALQQECPADTLCHDYTTGAHRPSTFCGDCLPGQHQCGPNGGIETCADTGTWGAEAPCAMGVCDAVVTTNNSEPDASCYTQCFPGATLCVGATADVPGLGITAHTMSATCTAEGTIPDSSSYTACAAGTLCRATPAKDGRPGTAYGCVACVGSVNEFGYPDTRCGDAYGYGGDLEVCKADDSGFSSTTCTAGSAVCHSAVTETCSDTEKSPGYCVGKYGSGTTVIGCGTTSDCCSATCSSSGTQTAVAYCE